MPASRSPSSLPSSPPVSPAVSSLAATTFHPTAGGVAAALVLFLTTGLRSLLELTADVVAATESDLEDGSRAGRGTGRPGYVDPLGRRLPSAAVEARPRTSRTGSSRPPFAVLAPVSLRPPRGRRDGSRASTRWIRCLAIPRSRSAPESARLDDLVMYLHPPASRPGTIGVASGRPTRARSRPTGAGPHRRRTPAGRWRRWPALSVRLEKPGVYALNPTPTSDAGGRRASRQRRRPGGRRRRRRRRGARGDRFRNSPGSSRLSGRSVSSYSR